ncbi:MAG: TolC family protein, partial [Candidatus Thiodiazotropha sp. (ex Rostrolucina anterorostrata)]|nr:TolC family protein [Candidatus Thiodiazotropha sp. (ex Rostrolucina anterorostrata)]
MSCTLSQDRQPEPTRQTFIDRAGDLLPKTMRLSTLAVCLLLAIQSLLISGCMNLGPDYQSPEAAVESDWLVSEDPPLTNEPLSDPRWWKTAFQDDDLNQLVETALKQNLTLRSAGLRVLQSQQQLAIAIGNQFPQEQQLTGAASRGKSTGVTFDNYNLGFNLSWEADFWGRFRRQVESASADLDVSVASFDGAVLSMVSQVAQNYILIRTFQDRIKVARSSIKNQEESVRITQAKFDAGEVSELDKDQAESLLYNTRATVPA